MLYFFVLTVAIFLIGLVIVRKVDNYLKWGKKVFLYRITCEKHEVTVDEITFRPNKYAFGCPFCGWDDKTNLLVERRAINTWSEWKSVG